MCKWPPAAICEKAAGDVPHFLISVYGGVLLLLTDRSHQRPDCPDPSRCQLQLDEKWRQALQAVSRYGPPQPSVAFRCLRQLETFPTNPSLVMHHPLCQSAAKSWIASCEFSATQTVLCRADSSVRPHVPAQDGVRRAQSRYGEGELMPAFNIADNQYWLYITIN